MGRKTTFRKTVAAIILLCILIIGLVVTIVILSSQLTYQEAFELPYSMEKKEQINEVTFLQENDITLLIAATCTVIVILLCLVGATLYLSCCTKLTQTPEVEDAGTSPVSLGIDDANASQEPDDTFIARVRGYWGSARKTLLPK